ncbi:hypothetical protein [Halobacteriovorax sp. RT-1-4]|uniref:hypothetical protein n=1 Tax=unclassified Halobacteriovorax TaxID=2639665 RepID=UPI00399B0DD1
MVLNLKSTVIGCGTSTQSGNDRVFSFVEFSDGTRIENVITSASIAEFFDSDEEIELAYFKVGQYYYIARAKVAKVVKVATTTPILVSMIVNFISIFFCFGILSFIITFIVIMYFLKDFKMALTYAAIIGVMPGAYYLTKLLKLFIELRQCRALIK